MKKYLLLVLLISLFQKLCVAQIQKLSVIDSLFAVLKTEKDDTSKVNTLNALANYYRNNDPDTAIWFAKEATVLASKQNYKMGIAEAYLCIGTAINNLGKNEEALKNLIKALSMYDILLSTGNKQDTIKILKQKLRVLNNIGIVFNGEGNYPEALKYYFAALKIEEETGYEKAMAITYNHIGSIYKVQKDYTNALKNHFIAKKIVEETGDKEGIADCYVYIGNIYFTQYNYPDALKNYADALKIYREMENDDGVANAYNNIAGIANEQGNYTEALKNYFASLTIREKMGDKESMTFIYNNVGSVYIKQKKNKKAAEYLNKGLAIAKEINSLDDIKESYSALATLDSVQGNYIKALEHYKLFVAYRDSLFNEENTKKLVQTQMQFDFDKKETLAKAEQEKKDAIAKNEFQKQSLIIKQKNTWLYLSLFVLASIILISFLVIRNNRQKQIIQTKKIKELEQEKQFVAVNSILQGQEAERTRLAKDLHDGLGGMLSGIKLNLSSMKGNMIIQEQDANLFNKSITQLDSAIAEMRRVAHNMMPEALLKFGLNEAIQDYCDGINESNTLKLKYTQLGITQPLEKSVEVILYRIIQELTNNAIKHADAKNIFIQLSKNENTLNLTVEDDGKGFDTTQLGNNKGAGLQNVQSRVDYLKGSLEIQSTIGNGTSVTIEIPA